MSGVSGPKLNAPRVSIDPPDRRAGGEPTGAPPKGHEPTKARIGRDAPEGFGPPPRPNSSARNELRPRLESQSVVAKLGASPVDPGVQAASRPRVTFNLEANTVKHYEIAAGAHLHPTRPRAPQAVQQELYADLELTARKRGNFVSRLLFGPPKTPDKF